jgi:hypothetical protein
MIGKDEAVDTGNVTWQMLDNPNSILVDKLYRIAIRGLGAGALAGCI